MADVDDNLNGKTNRTSSTFPKCHNETLNNVIRDAPDLILSSGSLLELFLSPCGFPLGCLVSSQLLKICQYMGRKNILQSSVLRSVWICVLTVLSDGRRLIRSIFPLRNLCSQIGSGSVTTLIWDKVLTEKECMSEQTLWNTVDPQRKQSRDWDTKKQWWDLRADVFFQCVRVRFVVLGLNPGIFTVVQNLCVKFQHPDVKFQFQMCLSSRVQKTEQLWNLSLVFILKNACKKHKWMEICLFCCATRIFFLISTVCKWNHNT